MVPVNKQILWFIMESTGVQSSAWRERSTDAFAASVCVLFAIYLLVASLAPRIEHITGFAEAAKYRAWFMAGMAFYATLALFYWRAKLGLTVTLIYGLLIAHAYCHLYWPSLRWGVPRQDYLLADQVSANYSFDQALIYLKTTYVGLVAALAAAYASVRTPRWAVGVLVGALGVSTLANFTLAAVQGLVDLTILSAGSGTAIDARRAAAFLEDSGASTVYLSAVVSGGFFLGVFGRWRIGWRILIGLLVLALWAAGAASGGRIYFVATSTSLVAALGLWVAGRMASRLRERDRQAHKVILAGALAVGMAVLIGGMVWWFRGGAALAFELGNRVLLAVDDVRAVHQKIMLRAFWEHPFFGTGFGSFYSNYFEHLAWALASGGMPFADPPASMYLMLMSELGLTGLIAVTLGLGLLTRAMWRCATRFRQRRTGSEMLHHWRCFACGLLLSLAVSGLVGIHVIFWSVPALFALGVFGLALPDRAGRGSSKPATPLVVSVVVIVGLLGSAILYQFLSAPRVPEFRWKARGKPQVPLSLNVPISTHGRSGTWLASGGEVVYAGSPLVLFFEMPPEYYPLTVKATLYGRDGQPAREWQDIVEHYDTQQPWKEFRVEFAGAPCADSVTWSSYCSVRIETSPTWDYYGHPIGVFVVAQDGSS